MDQTIPSNIPNINLLCRLCLCEDVYMFPIFNETNIYLPQRIAACVNVEVYNTDTISTLICKQCLKKINDWHEFKKYCTEAQSKLNYWSNLYSTTTNETTVEKSNSINIQEEEIIICDDEDVIISDSVDIKVETIEDNYEEISCNDEYTQNEEADPVSTTMYFSRDDETCLNEPEPETLLIPTHELSPDAHGLINPVRYYQQQKPTNTNGIVDLKISQVYQVISCRVCTLTFSSTSLRSKHEKREHMIYFKENKCFACNSIWNDESELIDHYNLNHSLKSGFFKTENKIIKNGCTYNTIEQSREYLKEFAENLIKLRNNVAGAKHVTINSFEYYNQCVQKIIDRNSMDSDSCLENVLEHLLEQNVIIKNSCHQCCISFKNVGEFKQHISKRYCKKRMRLVESGEIRANQHFKCVQCDRIFGCTTILTQHIRLEHVVDKVPERCRTCQKYFHSKQDFSAHVEEKCSYQIYCSICDELFNSTSAFTRHCDIHKEIIVKTEKEPQTIYRKKKKSDWNTKCCLCPKVYQYYYSLEKHFRMSHPKFNLNTCRYCGDIFLSESELERHKQYLHYDGSGEERTNDQMYFCTDCNSVFRTIDELERHKTVHSDSNSNMNEFSDSSSSLTCTICEQTFHMEEQLKQHIITKHKDGKIDRLRFRCTICKKDFKTNKSLVQHDKQKHSIAVKNLGISCPRCGKKFKTEQQIKYHMKHKGGCLPQTKKHSKSKVFNIKAEIDDENYNSNMNNSSYHGCIVCKKFFISKRNLVSHAKVHFPFKKMDGLPCPLCHKICETVEELLDHFKTHPSKEVNDYFGMLNASPTSRVNVKQEIDPDEFGCGPCGKYFGTKFGLTMHNVMKHPEKSTHTSTTTTTKPAITKPTIIKPTTSVAALPRPSPVNPILSTKCIVCNKIFPTTNDLIDHVQEHISRQHKFVCKKCNNLYDVDVYHMHMSKVHGIHYCVVCNKSSFISYVSLLGHVSWHKRGNAFSIKTEKSNF